MCWSYLPYVANGCSYCRAAVDMEHFYHVIFFFFLKVRRYPLVLLSMWDLLTSLEVWPQGQTTDLCFVSSAHSWRLPACLPHCRMCSYLARAQPDTCPPSPSLSSSTPLSFLPNTLRHFLVPRVKVHSSLSSIKLSSILRVGEGGEGKFWQLKKVKGSPLLPMLIMNVTLIRVTCN